jgi:nitrate/TMAO reductase-like tetraheme cytochrome c subunit
MKRLMGWVRVLWAVASLHWLGVLGAITASFAFVLFWVLFISQKMGLLENPYAGIFTFFVLPAAFFFGFVLIPISLWRFKKKTGVGFRTMFSDAFLEEHGGGTHSHRALPLFLAISFINLLFWGLGASSGFHYLETPEFCGTTCHPVMTPEWTVYQTSPHANVACVDCHIGHTLAGKVATKANGAYQVYSLTFDLFDRPIHTPVTTLRPAHETCQECHHQDYRQKQTFRTRIHFREDEENTKYYNTLVMKLTAQTEPRRIGIHNHATKTSTTTYIHEDEKRMNILYTRQEKIDGKVVEYWKRGLEKHEVESEFPERTMDCTDCHNRVSHVYEDPVLAVEKRMEEGAINPGIPNIRARAVKVLTKEYGSTDEAARKIPELLDNYYKYTYPEAALIMEEEIKEAEQALVACYRRNIFPDMNIGWNTYPSMSTHEGCWRCHNNDLVNARGETLAFDCTHCHSIMSYEADQPFSSFTLHDEDPEYEMYSYLKEEFIAHNK